MVRRVGFGDSNRRGQQEPKPRPARKIEKFHLEGAHAAKPEPVPDPVSTAPKQRPNPARAPISRKRFWIYVVIGIWALPMVIGFVTMIFHTLLGGMGFAPSPFIVIVFSVFIIYKLFQLGKKMMPPS